MAEQIVEIPLEVPEETPVAPQEEEPTPAPQEAVVKKAVGRPKGAKDTKPRAKPKPPPPPAPRERTPAQRESDDSDDDVTLREIGMLHLLRSLDNHRNTQKDKQKAMYARWFGR